MRETFERVMPWVLAHEGGYVHHPEDPGGATNMGVTQATFTGYLRAKGAPNRPVANITPDEVATIYRGQYWNAVRGDDLPAGLDYAVFDYAVNSGPARAARDLQRELGVTVDGIIGQQTLGALAGRDVPALIESLCARRMAFLRRLRHWPTFGKGWTRRVMGMRAGVQFNDTGVIDRAVWIAQGVGGIPDPRPSVDATAKAPPGEERASAVLRDLATNKSALGSLTGAGGLATALVATDSEAIQYAVAACIVAGAVVLAVVMLRTLRT